MEKKYYIIYITVRGGQLSPLNFCLLAGATEPQIPGQPDTRTVSSPRQSTLWTVKCSLHYALKICTFFFIFICYHLHPSTSLHLFLFYSILSSIPQLYTAIDLSIFVYLYLHMCIFFTLILFFIVFVYWKLMSLKKEIPCMRKAYLAIKLFLILIKF